MLFGGDHCKMKSHLLVCCLSAFVIVAICAKSKRQMTGGVMAGAEVQSNSNDRNVKKMLKEMEDYLNSRHSSKIVYQFGKAVDVKTQPLMNTKYTITFELATCIRCDENQKELCDKLNRKQTCKTIFYDARDNRKEEIRKAIKQTTCSLE